MIIDGHSDILIDVGKRWERGERGRLADYHVPRMLEGGVTGAWCPIAVDNPSHAGDPFERACRTLDAVHDEVARSGGTAELVRDARGFESTMRAGKVAIFLGMEGAMPLAGDVERLRLFHNAGIRWIGLTWNAPNEVGRGLGSPGTGGLTDAGRALLHEMERLGVVIDLTHGSPELYADAFAATTAPLAVSHSNARALCDHVRNLDDAQLALAAQRDGIVGVNLFPALVRDDGQPPTMDDVVRHATYLRDRLGDGGVTFGFDFIDYDETAMAAGLAASALDYGATTTYPPGVPDTRGGRNVVQVLADAGWTDDQRQAIAWRNVIRFVAAVEAHATAGAA